MTRPLAVLFLAAALLAGCADASPDASRGTSDLDVPTPLTSTTAEVHPADSTDSADLDAPDLDAAPDEDAEDTPADASPSEPPPPVLPPPPLVEALGPIVCHIVPPTSLDEGAVTVTNRAARPVTRLYIGRCEAVAAHEAAQGEGRAPGTQEVLYGRPIAPDSSVWLELDDGCYQFEPHAAEGAARSREVRVAGPTEVALTLDPR